ncbi:MAG: acetate--CoA ligase family protein [Gammaproteobacteria bacterium]
MNILEFQAKELLRAYDVRVPDGEAAASAEQAHAAAQRLGGARWMVKAQIAAGGRGRGRFAGGGRGGVRIADSLEAVRKHAAAMLGKSLVTRQTGNDGLPVEHVYVEQAAAVERELAVSLLVNERRRQLELLLFARGGVGIEEHENSNVQRAGITAAGADADALASAIASLSLPAQMQKELGGIIAGLIRLFRDKDARLIEINPLAICDGRLLALDAKISIDDNALFRQPKIREFEPLGRRAGLDEFNYIRLHGDIATLAVGAGLAMATLDALRHYGGAPANFLALPPDSKVNKVVGALEALLAATSAKCLLVNVFGGGIMRCDSMSDAILLLRHAAPRLPMVVRLAGTNAELANRRLRESAPDIVLAGDLAEAARAAADMSRGGLRKFLRRAAGAN